MNEQRRAGKLTRGGNGRTTARRVRRELALALVVLLGATLLVGCSGNEPTAHVSKTSTESQTPSSKEREKQQNITEAKAAVEAFFDATRSDYANWRETVMPLVTGQFKSTLEERLPKLEMSEETTIGGTTVARSGLNDYYTDSKTGALVVKLNVCADSSTLRKFENGVEKTPGPDDLLRWLVVYQVERAAGSDTWLIANETETGDPC